MQTNSFEEAFADFIDSRDYDEAETALFDIIRAAFLAGWHSAGGTPPQPQKIFELVHGGEEPPQY